MPYQIRVDRWFAASHQLRLPDDALEPRHGHGWSVSVVVESDQLDAMDCVMDFHELQRQIDRVLSGWDRQHLNDVEPFRSGTNPSAERVAESIARGLAVPAPARLVRVDVGEASGCVASWICRESNEVGRNGR